ncbi:DGQHR domain-containing protein [Listeria booriae]|uniref:DGQHR domain-containing protein n=1 Tax=Listeria booriae TaxID=1552123 RepID=UPI001626F13B|nr:DGQHR domain-containing protein [Listeria booriae]MBC1906586.1 DGQHR domain-containing protein [Listeria booriae]
MRRIAFKYKQYDQFFYSTTLNYSTLNSISEVLVYDKNFLGYQRELDKKHLNRMVASLKSKEVLSPTSIILGVDDKYIKQLVSPINQSIKFDEIIKDEGAEYINFSPDGKFRVIDGQHRLAAFGKYIEELSREKKVEERELLLNDYTFSVIIVIINENEMSKEVEMFRSINSKAKRLKLDKAMLAEYRYQIFEKREDIDYIFHIKTRAIYYLIEDMGEKILNCWRNGIKVDIIEKTPLGIVGYKPFYDSIDKILKTSIFNTELENMKKNLEYLGDDKSFDLIDRTLEKLSRILAMEILIPAWEMVHAKWTDAFKEKDIVYNGELERTYYNDDYYIQQTIGVNAINNILGDTLINEQEYNEGMEKFYAIIANSKLTSQSWRKGGLMLGLSSEAGSKIIKSMIKNESDK